MTRRPSPRRGFTLIEAIATITVIAVLGSVSSLIIGRSVDSFSGASKSSQLYGEVNTALEFIDRDLRTIGAKAGVGVPNITSVASSSITWNTDYSLSISGSRLMYVNDGAPAAILLDNVSAFSVQAYNESNAALAATLSGAACDPIRRLMISITVQREGVAQTARTKIYLRCTMEGAS